MADPLVVSRDIAPIHSGVTLGGDRFTIWMLKTNEVIGTVDDSGWFAAMADPDGVAPGHTLSVNDLIIALTDLDGTPKLSFLRVTDVSGAGAGTAVPMAVSTS